MYTISIPEQYIDVLYAALGELPLKNAGPVFTLIQRQVEEQKQKPVEQAT